MSSEQSSVEAGRVVQEWLSTADAARYLGLTSHRIRAEFASGGHSRARSLLCMRGKQHPKGKEAPWRRRIWTTGIIDGRVYYPSYGGFYANRTTPIFNRLVADSPMREELGLTDDTLLADAMLHAENLADSERGFRGWDYGSGAAQAFIAEHST